MTRTLPWLKGPSTSAPQVSRSPRNVAPRAKRRRVVEPSSDIDDNNGGGLKGDKVLQERASPPPAPGPPSESSMDEGLDEDDRFRMVEDEFLDMAKQFTQHLHAAEYQRLKKAARSQNAAVISSISRPVSVRMPDETIRKVESVARAKKQAAAVQDLVRKRGLEPGSDEDSDSRGGAWLGTALHGLMESPRNSTASLTKTGNVVASTRDFDEFPPLKSFKNSPPHSPDLESFEVTNEGARPRKRDPRESSSDENDDDDLDAPIRSRTQVISNAPAPDSHVTKQERDELPSRIFKSSVIATSSRTVVNKSDDTSSNIARSSRERIANRLEQARLRRVNEEQEAQEKLEIIPMFLS